MRDVRVPCQGVRLVAPILMGRFSPRQSRVSIPCFLVIVRANGCPLTVRVNCRRMEWYGSYYVPYRRK